jgi:hypothetical protein
MARNGTNDELYSPVNLLELVQNEEGGGEWAVGQQSFSARENHNVSNSARLAAVGQQSFSARENDADHT